MSHTQSTALRLSAQRALLGAIPGDVRLIAITDDGHTIDVTVIAARALDDAAAEALSIAATEIIADFPDRLLREHCHVETGPLASENVLTHGWVYRRYE